jgi:hypothetical protein
MIRIGAGHTLVTAFALVALVAVVAGSGCTTDAASAEGAAQHADAASHEDAAPHADSDASKGAMPLPAIVNSEPGALRTVTSEPVHGRTGPGGQPFEVALRTSDTRAGHARRFGMRTLQVQLRTTAPDMVNYPCSSCHAGRAIVMTDDRIADAHTSLRVVHPGETGAACATCHAQDDVELLALRSGERASLDHAYRVCAQCHFAQADAWAAGAHGKRLDGWQGRRVVMGCTDCHDPHAPALTARLPFRAPRLHRPGSRLP